jgi:hypothetical protein
VGLLPFFGKKIYSTFGNLFQVGFGDDTKRTEKESHFFLLFPKESARTTHKSAIAS